MMTGQMTCAFGADDVSTSPFRKLRFQMIDNSDALVVGDHYSGQRASARNVRYWSSGVPREGVFLYN